MKVWKLLGRTVLYFIHL